MNTEQSALVLTEEEWKQVAAICEEFLRSGNDWAERDDDDEALEIRSQRALARRIIDVA